MNRTTRRVERERKKHKAPLPMVGGPLDGQVHPEKGNASQGTKVTRQVWDGEYERFGNVWRWRAPAGATNGATDRINVARLPSHPSAKVMADYGANVAKRIRSEGTQATRWANVYATRGLPASVNGSGSHSAEQSTSVERAVGLTGDDGDPTPLDPKLIDLDLNLARAHRAFHMAGLKVLELYDLIRSHADDSDPIPAGTGSCRRCGQFWRPDAKHPNNRIKAGYGAPCCYMKWYNAGQPDKTLFDRTKTDDEIAELVARLNGETAA